MKKKVPSSLEPFDCELPKQKVKEQLRSGKSLFGKEGAFAPLLQEMPNSILEGEMEGTWMRKSGMPVTGKMARARNN